MTGNGEHSNTDWKMLKEPLSTVDPELHSILRNEKQRQINCLEMIASENFTSTAVQQALASCMTNKYSEGQVGARYYGGNEHVDEMELLCKSRALQAFRLSPDEWGVNVQSLSGSPANFAVYTALVGPHGRIMGLDLPDGGHLSHGFYTPSKKVSATSLFFESLPYKVNPDTGLIDYDALEKSAQLFKPKMIVAGISCYSQNLDYARFRAICDGCGAMLLADMAHISGLVAAGCVPSPFEFADVVTTTTHKSLRGPRAALIFFRKGSRTVNGKEQVYSYEQRINEAVFPGLQGGPHNNAIAGVAVSLKLCLADDYVTYQKQVISNAKALVGKLQEFGYKIVTGSTVNHLCLVDFRPNKLDGSKVEKVLDLVGITANKNTCPGDKSALRPSGVRFGTPALTTRSLVESDMHQVAQFIHAAVGITADAAEAAAAAAAAGGSGAAVKLSDFTKVLKDDAQIADKIKALKQQVQQFASKFPMPGLEEF